MGTPDTTSAGITAVRNMSACGNGKTERQSNVWQITGWNCAFEALGCLPQQICTCEVAHDLRQQTTRLPTFCCPLIVHPTEPLPDPMTPLLPAPRTSSTGSFGSRGMKVSLLPAAARRHEPSCATAQQKGEEPMHHGGC